MEIDIKKILSKLSFFGGKDTPKRDMNPHRDWAILFVAFAILTIAASAGSAYMFIQIGQDDLFNSNNGREKQVKEFDTAKLTETIRIFEEKTRKLEELRATRPTIIDPAQ